MTKKDAAKILAVLKVAYPMGYRDMSVEDRKATVNLWAEMFQDESYAEVSAAVKQFIATDDRGFAPNIGQIKRILHSRQSPDNEMTPMEAAAILMQAISNSGYHAKEEFEKLPPVLQRVVRHPQMLFEWSQIDSETLHSVIMSNVQRSFTVVQKQEEEQAMLPENLKTKALVLDVTEKLRLKA